MSTFPPGPIKEVRHKWYPLGEERPPLLITSSLNCSLAGMTQKPPRSPPKVGQAALFFPACS